MEWNFSHLSASFPRLFSTRSLAAVMHALHSRPHISCSCNAEHCYRQQELWFSRWMLPLLEGPCFWQSYHKFQGHCQVSSITRSWCALHASLMVGRFLLHAAMSGGRDGPMLQGRHPRCHTILEDCFISHLSLLGTRSRISQSCSLGQALYESILVMHIPLMQRNLPDTMYPCYCFSVTLHQILPR
jgi:hypothetical protein